MVKNIIAIRDLNISKKRGISTLEQSIVVIKSIEKENSEKKWRIFMVEETSLPEKF